MNLPLKEQKREVFGVSDSNNLEKMLEWILIKKANDFEERITTIESELEGLHGEWSPFDERMTNDTQYLSYKSKIRSDDHSNERTDDKRTEWKLEHMVSELKEAEDKKTQVQIVGGLVEEIRDMLKRISKENNNYRRRVLLLLHETLKQNYTKKLFNNAQVRALVEVAGLCSESFVTKAQYFKMDDLLCECGLDMMPDLE